MKAKAVEPSEKDMEILYKLKEKNKEDWEEL